MPLAPVRDAALVVPLIAERLGASGDSAAAIATRIGEKRAHVVLDNLEQLLPDAARPLAELLAAAPALRIVATSREPLRIAGESEFDLPPMDEGDAVTLFIERAQAVRADVGDSLAVHELIRRLDGLPLAIELAAARVKLLGPEQLLERIAQRLDLLKGGRDADERHATLRTTIAWSYDLLDDDEQQLFARLAVFRGGCTLDAAEAVCDADLDTLASLLDKSLVRRRTDANGDERFWMLETIREFARERLAASGEEDALRRLQTDWLIELADRAGTRATVGVPGKWDVDLVAPEIDNVRAVLEWAPEHEPERGLALAASLEGFWLVREPGEGASRLEPLLARTPDAEPELRAHALRALGGALDLCRRLRTRRALLPAEPRALHRKRRRDPDGEPPLPRRWTHGDDGRDGRRLAAARGITPYISAARPASRRGPGTRIPRGEAPRRGRSRARDRAHARERRDRARDWLGMVGERTARGAAELERERGDLDAAEGHALRCLELSLGLGDRRRAVLTAAKLAVIAAERGDPEQAGRLWGAIESEQASRPVRQWENRREELEALVLGVDGPAFARARAEGRLLSIAEAAGLDAR